MIWPGAERAPFSGVFADQPEVTERNVEEEQETRKRDHLKFQRRRLQNQPDPEAQPVGGRFHGPQIDRDLKKPRGNITALRALREHPTPQAIPALIEALDSPWSEVYDAALQTLRAYVDVYAEGAWETEDPDSPWVELRRAIPELTYLLHDDSARTRRLALETLGAFRDPGTVQEVAYLLMDDKEDIRFLAVRVLESIGDEGAIAVLRAYLERGDRHEGTADEDLYAEIAEVLSRLAAHPG